MMDDSPIQRIKEKLDIVEVVSRYVKLQKTGINYRALCPFHSEKKPSFFVSPTRQMFKCFGCNSGGDIFEFIQQIEGVEFGDALRVLAQRAGVELKPQRPELKTERQRLYEILELGCRFFQKQLQESEAAREVKKYLLQRGISEDSIKKWRLGYSPETWQGLSDFLVSQGFQREEVVKAGLAVEKTEDKSFRSYDRFRGRIMFPVFDFNSQVIGFGARITESAEKEGETAKYINTPGTPLYDKSRSLYGLDSARIDIRKKDFAVLVEGYTDVILAHQAGFTNTVASSGTALTVPQLRILKRYSSRLLSSFDMDTAGDLATQKGIELAQKEDFEVKVLTMPKDADPAEIIAKDPQKWAELIDRAKSIMDFYFESAFAKFDTEKAEGKKEIARVLLPFIKRIANKIVQAHWLLQLAAKLKIGEAAVREELNKIPEPELEKEIAGLPEPAGTEVPAGAEKAAKSRKEMLEERIVSLILQCPECLQELPEETLCFFSSAGQEILQRFKEQNDFKAVLASFQEKNLPDLAVFAQAAAFRAEIEEIDDPQREFKICLRELGSIFWKEKLTGLSEDISRAEQDGNQKEVKKLSEEFQRLSKNLIKNK